MYRIGKLAQEAGISIRTLRYYDKLGLLKPTMVSESGYRYYTNEDVMRLQHISTLKQLGFTLAEIANVLSSAEQEGNRAESWKHAIRLQIEEVRKEQKRLHLLDRMLHITLHTVEVRGDVNAEEVLGFIQITEANTATGENGKLRDALRKANFTQEELPILEALPSLDTDDPRNLNWLRLLKEVHERLNVPHDSDSESDLESEDRLAEKLLTVGEELFQGSDQLFEKYWEWVRPEPGKHEKVLGLDGETMAYIDRIVDAYLLRQQENTTKGRDES
ncbi:MerR family transcriptional regulator [Paenibacillus eucommiae]|uniref:DNA-binding transcriptional MerR regulator n=1 Tax=Paenibacillus eucommiae TaxID=1355755 RepID=A0ABS4J6U4_9BACL|nr:MerR family transcriptional regulator [Paenibacillus eucommiae]MBP1995537.1 DNA-binding transcriptional MerR regulator [Paenibacillus eucommiae]